MLGPLVCKWVGLTYPKSIQTFILRQGSETEAMVSTDRRHGQTKTDQKHYHMTNFFFIFGFGELKKI